MRKAYMIVDTMKYFPDDFAQSAVNVVTYPSIQYRGAYIIPSNGEFEVFGTRYSKLILAMSAVDASYTSLENSIK